MPNIMDENVVNEIIELQKSLGWDVESAENKRWTAFLEREIEELRSQMKAAITEKRTPQFNTASGDGTIHGVAGHDRFAIRNDGEVVFLITFCDYTNKTLATNKAINSGWVVV